MDAGRLVGPRIWQDSNLLLSGISDLFAGEPLMRFSSQRVLSYSPIRSRRSFPTVMSISITMCTWRSPPVAPKKLSLTYPDQCSVEADARWRRGTNEVDETAVAYSWEQTDSLLPLC